MSDYRAALPQTSGALFLTDGGIETDLIFHDRLDLPLFSAFTLLKTPDGKEALRRYYRRYLPIAARHKSGFIFESPTWRANADWAAKLGYSRAALADANREAIALMEDLRKAEGAAEPRVVSGCIGPRGDGYVPGELMSAAEAEDYHGAQIDTFRGTAADMVTALTMTNVPEAVGIARAAVAAGMPSAIAFTLETDGRLPTGQPLAEAIAEVDAATDAAPAYYMVNCAHPSHFAGRLGESRGSLARLKGPARQCLQAQPCRAQ